MENENDISGDINLGETWLHPRPALKDVFEGGLTQLQIYWNALECTKWSLEEKEAFLRDPENRAFLQEFGGPNMDRRYNLPVNDRDFVTEFSESNADRVARLLATEGLFD